jgi:hypothetical protein
MHKSLQELSENLARTNALNLPYFDRINELIQEALACLSRLGVKYELELAPAFAESLNVLQKPAAIPSQQLLLLSAVQRRIKFAEKTILNGILHGHAVTSSKMSDLVRIRLVCSELLNILNDVNLTLKNKRI